MSGTGMIAAKVFPKGAHGGGVRGDDMRRRSSLFEGRFGRIFRELPAAAWPEDALRKLGEAMTAAPETDPANPTLPSASPETAALLQDDEENAGIPAGYTYFGQFIDHDITFDPASKLQQLNDPDGLVDFRTPRLDLDCLYGRGPDDQPYMFAGKKFRLGRPLSELDQPSPRRDLPRYDDVEDPTRPKRALIGDKRNDENVIVSQFQSTMMQFHNKLVDLFPDEDFQSIQQRVQWHYQWLVVNDYLVHICGAEMVDDILPYRLDSKPAQLKSPKLHYYKWRRDPFIPIEFSAAAYRFGHSMVRPIYRLNTRLTGGDDPLQATTAEIARGLAGRFFIFAGVQTRGLNGFAAFPQQWAIDWSLFFDINGSGQLGGSKRVQPAYKIDTSLVNPLGFLPEFSNTTSPNPPLTIAQLQAAPKDPARNPANLATRNLLRGMAMQLPSGQAVAAAMGIEPLTDAELKVGKAVLGAVATNKPITDLDPSFAGNAPLWFYILAEAQAEWVHRASAPGSAGDAEPARLGPVGGRLVAETLIGLLDGDGHSYMRQSPNWKPELNGRRLDTIGALLHFACE
ncbi:MAG: heme peroxidase family protein [Acetobacteraceae bacterium]